VAVCGNKAEIVCSLAVMNEYNNVAVCNITFYKFDDDGNELLNEDGTIKEFDLKANRFKPLEYLCEDLDADDLEEIKENENECNQG
jgi:hypothetical protein